MAYNSTIIRKKKKCVSCGANTYIFSRGRCEQCSRIEDSTRRIQENEIQEEVETIQGLVEDLDVWFSKYIRLSHADERGILKCYTCDNEMRVQESQCGHFIPRANYATRWMPENCRPQCARCNEVLRGNMEVFAKKLEQEKAGIVEHLRDLSRSVEKTTREDLKILLSDFRFRAKVLEKKLRGRK